MAEASKSLGSVQFGPFELLLDTQELRKHGRPVKLSGQAIQTLTVLATRPGQLVTREELQRKLWPTDSYGDFEHGLNAAINKLREKLGDSATTPTYVETLPARGYRFIGKIEPEEPTLSVIEPGPQKFFRKSRGSIVALALVIALIAGGIYYRSRYLTGHLTEKDTILLADFSNTTGNSIFDDTLKQGLSVQLNQSPFLQLVSDRKVNETLKLMTRPVGERLTPEVARDVCQRTGSTATVNGSIAELGSQYVIGVKVVNCNSGDVLAEVQEHSEKTESVLKALDKAAVELRSKLGESRSSVEKYSAPLPEITTSSLDALKTFSLGRKMQLANGDSAALPFYKRAVELDPNFAIAYAALSFTYGNLGEGMLSAENARKAYELRERVSERERFVIDFAYRTNTGELEESAQICERWKETYPRDYLPYGDLGVIYRALGKLEKALEEAREAHRRAPNAANTYANLGLDYVNLNRLDEAEAVYKEAQDRKLGDELLVYYRYGLAFLKGDTARMEQLATGSTGESGTEDSLPLLEADTAAWYGKYHRAGELTKAGIDSAQLSGAKEGAAALQAAEALREVEAGYTKLARRDAAAAVILAPGRDVLGLAALALARAGDTVAAGTLASELSQRYPLDTLVQRYILPTVRAAIALQRSDPSRAIELLKPTSVIELGQPTDANVLLLPAYLRGEAYLMLHDGKGAAAEFQKFIDHRGLVGNFSFGALARLGLARAYAAQGNTVSARATYEDFLTLWKDADPDVPIFIQAKAEYTKLR